MKDEYEKLIKKDFYNLKNHRGYIDAYLALRVKRYSKTMDAKDLVFAGEYQHYIDSPNRAVRDVGLYGLAYFFDQEKKGKDGQDALALLQKIHNKNKPFVNNTIGYTYLNGLNQPANAENYFYKEISIKGNVNAAVFNLSQLFWVKQKPGEAEKA